MKLIKLKKSFPLFTLLMIGAINTAANYKPVSKKLPEGNQHYVVGASYDLTDGKVEFFH